MAAPDNDEKESVPEVIQSKHSAVGFLVLRSMQTPEAKLREDLESTSMNVMALVCKAACFHQFFVETCRWLTFSPVIAIHRPENTAASKKVAHTDAIIFSLKERQQRPAS